MVAQRLVNMPEITSCRGYCVIKKQTYTVIDPESIFESSHDANQLIPNDNKDRHMTHSSDARNTFMLCNVYRH